MASTRCATFRCSRRCIAARRASTRSTRRCRRGSTPMPPGHRSPSATTTLRAGDKVMQVRNNYDKGAGGVFNGDLGRIVEIDAREPAGARCASPMSAGAAARRLRAARAGRADAGLCVQHPPRAGQRVSLRRAATGPQHYLHAAAQPALHGDHPRAPPLRDRRRPARAAPRRRERRAASAQHRRWPSGCAGRNWAAAAPSRRAKRHCEGAA